MSEEMKQKARELVLKSGHVTKDGTYYQSGTEKLLELIAQVCEQREKEHGNQFCERHIDTTLAVANVSEPCPLCQLEQRAEAAELALQNQIENWQKRIYETCKKVYPEVDGGGCDSGDELDFSIAEIEQTFAQLADYGVCSYCGQKTEKYRTKEQMVDVLAEHIPNCPSHPVNQAVAAFEENDKLRAALQNAKKENLDLRGGLAIARNSENDWRVQAHRAQERNAELQAALQAKEQELAQLRLGLAADLLKVTDAAKLSVAQARQQAIAETREEVCRLAEVAANGNSPVSAQTLRSLAALVRSLTPPPALTHPFCDDCGHEEHSHGSKHVPCIVINCPCKGWKVAPALTKEK